jgi:flavodoxin
MSILVIYYSRTGMTKKVGDLIVNELLCDHEEIFDAKSRKGPFGYMSAGKAASRKELTELKQVKKNPSKYDIVVIGTPVWSWNMSAPVRTYIEMYKNKFNEVAFFLTCGSNPGKTFEDMETICGKQPKARLMLVKKDYKVGAVEGKVRKFVEELRRA